MTLLKVSRSTTPKVLVRIDFWLFLLGHVIAWVCFNAGVFGPVGTADDWLSLLKLGWSDLNVMFLLTALVLSFAINQAYGRFLQLGQLSKKAMGAVYDYVYEARLILDTAGLPYDRLACRWLAASVLLVLCEVKFASMPATGHTRIRMHEWEQLVEFGLITYDEVDFLAPLDPKSRLLLMMHTAADLTQKGLQAGEVQEANVLAKSIMQKIRVCKTKQEELLDQSIMLLPFEYFHLLSLLVTGTLAFLGYTMAFSETWLAPPCYVITVLVILGLVELLSSLQDPFGPGGEVDFPVSSWVEEFTANAWKLLAYSHPGAKTQWASQLKAEAAERPHLALGKFQVTAILDSHDTWSVQMPPTPQTTKATQEGGQQTTTETAAATGILGSAWGNVLALGNGSGAVTSSSSAPALGSSRALERGESPRETAKGDNDYSLPGSSAFASIGASFRSLIETPPNLRDAFLAESGETRPPPAATGPPPAATGQGH